MRILFNVNTLKHNKIIKDCYYFWPLYEFNRKRTRRNPNYAKYGF